MNLIVQLQESTQTERPLNRKTRKVVNRYQVEMMKDKRFHVERGVYRIRKYSPRQKTT